MKTRLIFNDKKLVKIKATFGTGIPLSSLYVILSINNEHFYGYGAVFDEGKPHILPHEPILDLCDNIKMFHKNLNKYIDIIQQTYDYFKIQLAIYNGL